MTELLPPDWRLQPRAEIAANIRAELGRAKIPPADLTAILGLHRSSARDRYTGRTSYTAEDIIALAARLDIPADTLLHITAGDGAR